jgi:hypothetical protein
MTRRSIIVTDDLLAKHSFTRDEFEQAKALISRVRKVTREAADSVATAKDVQERVARKRQHPMIVCQSCGAFVRYNMKRHLATARCKRETALKNMEDQVADYNK